MNRKGLRSMKMTRDDVTLRGALAESSCRDALKRLRTAYRDGGDDELRLRVAVVLARFEEWEEWYEHNERLENSPGRRPYK